MEWVVIVTILALLQFVWFGVEVGAARARHGVRAPAMSGHPEFDRRFRIHMNTLEQLVVFLPALWIFGHYVDPRWGAGLGIVYLAGRLVYRTAYFRDPAGRSAGFTITFLPMAVMLVWTLVVAIGRLV